MWYASDPAGAHQAAHPYSRRNFLQASAGAAFLGGLGSIGELGRAMAAQARIEPQLVRLSAEIEPIVRVLEDTPRGRIIDAAAGLLRSGVGYRPLMAALYLAGIRNVDSRNSGSRFHCVYVINSAHLLALESPAQERLLPLFWAIDEFKVAQAMQSRRMKTLTGRIPSGAEAIAEVRTAVQAWDGDRAELALAGMARTCGAAEAFEELWRLGARDIRPIGHKAIFVANTWRTLQTIGWQHAEPAFRALGQSLAGYGPTAVNNGFTFDNQCHATNDELVRAHVAELPADWADDSTPDSGADAATAATLLAAIRTARSGRACKEALALLTASKIRVGAVWDVVHLAAAEFMLLRRGIVAVHAVTSVNALHFAFRMARSTETRLFILLQAVGWMAHFAYATGISSGGSSGAGILGLAGSEIPDDPAAAAESILAQLGADVCTTADAAFAYAQRHANRPELFSGARRLIFTKSTESHDYKYPAAAFEDISNVSPAWRPHMLAASMLYVPARTNADSNVIQRAKEAVAGL